MKQALFGIQTQVSLLFSLLTIILVAATARLAYVSARQIYLGQLQEQIDLQGAVAADNLDVRFLAFLTGDSSAADRHYQKHLKEECTRLGVSSLFLFDSSGTTLEALNRPEASAAVALNLKELQTLDTGKAFTSLPFKAGDGKWYLWHFRRLSSGYFLGMQVQGRYLEDLEQLSWAFLRIGIIGLLLVLVAAWLIGRRIAQPVNKLVQFSGRIGRGDLKADAPDGVYGELARLQKALTNMQTNLAAHQQEKERILAQIAHELRNPLGGISLLAGLIREAPQATEQNEAYAERILAETEGLKSQIGAYLNFSKPVEVRPEEVQLETLFTELQELFTTSCAKRQIKLQFNAEHPTFRFDRGHLKQVLSNLIENSLRFTPEQGNIEVVANNHSIKVRDDGKGIAPEQLDHIFEPFYSASEDGVGLGLAICRKLCIENDCTLKSENNFIQGCTFTIQRNKI